MATRFTLQDYCERRNYCIRKIESVIGVGIITQGIGVLLHANTVVKSLSSEFLNGIIF